MPVSRRARAGSPLPSRDTVPASRVVRLLSTISRTGVVHAPPTDATICRSHQTCRHGPSPPNGRIISYLPTDEGWLYQAAIKDMATRQIVGWSMADHLKADLCIDAPVMALQRGSRAEA